MSNTEELLAVAHAQTLNRMRQEVRGTRLPLERGLRLVLFLLSVAATTALSVLVAGSLWGGAGAAGGMPVGLGLGFLVGAWVSNLIYITAQWERAVVLRLGRFHAIRGPGPLIAFPIVDHVTYVDTRLLTLDVPQQQVITRDNVPVRIDGVVFFLVQDPQTAVLTVQDYRQAILHYAKAALRDLIGSSSLDELLQERDQIQARIATVIDERAKGWGIHVDSIRLLDIDMPEELKRMMSRQASAEREKRATITKAEGDKEAAFNLAEAAHTMARSPGAMQLRTLQTLDGLGGSPSNTVLMAVPVEVMDMVRRFARPETPAPQVPPKPEGSEK